MAGCLITSGLDCTPCANAFIAPGIQKDEIYLANKSEISGTATNGTFSSFTFSAYAGLHKICVHKDSASFTEEFASEANTGKYWKETFTFRVMDYDIDTRNWIQDLCGADGIVVVYKTKEGQWQVAGWDNGLEVTANTFNTGAAAGDELGDIVTLTGVATNKHYRFFDTSDATTAATLASYEI